MQSHPSPSTAPGPDMRRHRRFERRLRVVLRHGDHERACITRNISLGGMYLVTPEPIPYGTVVAITVPLPALREPLTVEATVRWQGPDGLGVQFGVLAPKVVWALNRLFEQSVPSRD